MGFIPADFWWEHITGPNVLVSKVSEALKDHHMVVLSVPTDLPWRHSMRATIQSQFRDWLNDGNIVAEDIDAVDDNPDGSEPGRFILSRFSDIKTSRGYREKSKVSIQNYIAAKSVIDNRIIWVKGLKDDTAKQWVKFCRGFDSGMLQNVWFVLEVQGEINRAEYKHLKSIRFEDYVSNYDVQLFNSFALDSQNKYTDEWKKYIASVAASVCDTDAEVAAELLGAVDFRSQSVIDGIKSIAESTEFARRGTEESSKHVLWYCRNGNNEELEHRLWRAQVQVLFPIIEMERISLINKWHIVIQNALDDNAVTQFNEPLTTAEDAELGSLCYMMKQRTSDGFYMLYIPDEDERSRLTFLHECRNQLAHASCCTTDQVVRLLER